MWREFREFAVRGSVVDLAVGLIIGAAFTTIVNSLVNDIIMPPIGLVLGGVDFSSFFITLKGAGSYPTPEAAKVAGAVTLNYGLFINAIIKFVIVAFAVFLLVKQINRLKFSIGPAAALPARQEVLLGEIRDLLKQQNELKRARKNAGSALKPLEPASYRFNSDGSCTLVSWPFTGSAIASSMLRTPFHSSGRRTEPLLPIWSMPQ